MKKNTPMNIYISDVMKKKMIGCHIIIYQLSFVSLSLSLERRERDRKRQIVQLVELKMKTNIRIGRRNDETSSIMIKKHQLMK